METTRKNIKTKTKSLNDWHDKRKNLLVYQIIHTIEKRKDKIRAIERLLEVKKQQ